MDAVQGCLYRIRVGGGILSMDLEMGISIGEYAFAFPSSNGLHEFSYYDEGDWNLRALVVFSNSHSCPDDGCSDS